MPMKQDLNPIKYAVRATQAVQQYGVGAMVDFPDQVLVTSNPEEWERPKTIHDERFAKTLGVKWFAMPTSVSYARFPRWYFCPKCRHFQSLSDWIHEYRARNPNMRDSNMSERLRCSICHCDLVPSRIVTICESGHLDDFPWVEWLHVKNHKEPCNHPTLLFKTGTSSSEGIEGIIIECASCHTKSSLGGVFNKDCFQKLEEEASGDVHFFCKGHHPFKGEYEKCTLFPKTTLRGNSSVYFPLTYSSLVIPPYSEKLRTKIEQSEAFYMYEHFIVDEPENERESFIQSHIDRWAENIARENSHKAEEVKQILVQKWLSQSDEIDDITSIRYRMSEFDALTGKVTPSTNEGGDFVRVPMRISDYDIPFLKSVSLIEKVRIVTAFVGFSRVNPVTKMTDKGFVSIKKAETPWYPANEVRGEGIFIEFDNDAINNWIIQNPEISKRGQILTKNFAESFEGSQHPRVITPRFVMLHTLSHLLIKQLSFECGYNIASLSERIYCSEKEDGQEMAGIFIYTSSGDSEGTLGGLVRQGRPDVLPNIFKKAVGDAFACSNDPVCTLSHGQGRESLNLAACHACTLLPETCCEFRNSFLDRCTIVGGYTNRDIGFWSSLDISMAATQKAKTTSTGPNSWTQSHKGNPAATSNPFSDGTYNTEVKYVVGQNLKADYESWKDVAVIIDNFDISSLTSSGIPLADEYGGILNVGDQKIDTLFTWPDKKIAIVDFELNDSIISSLKANRWDIIGLQNLDIQMLNKLISEK